MACQMAYNCVTDFDGKITTNWLRDNCYGWYIRSQCGPHIILMPMFLVHCTWLLLWYRKCAEWQKKPFYNFPLVFFSHSTHSNKYHILDKINSDQTDIVEGVYSPIPNKPNTCFSWWTLPGKITKILTYK